ncbi:MAG: SDR family oxidoreductase [Gammaproteobacteria bacterium]|nr:SDR family oxidoreductase [Gammaproteobacteria bacterium]
MKTLVTGGAGFIGSHLVERLINDGHQVIALDDLSSGRWENLATVADAPGLQTVQADITDKQAIAPHFIGVDWVFHLAGKADIVPSIEQPDIYYAANVQGTFNVLECSRAANIKRLVYAASSSCYGIPDTYPTPEDAETRSQYPYALTKYLGEEMVLHWAQVYGLPALSLRLFNVYGPRSRTTGAYGAVFGVFLAQKLAGKAYTVVGDGKQSRDFTYVTDVADAFTTAAASHVSGEIFNVGSGHHYSINELVGHLGGDVEYIPKRPGEPDCTFADVSRIHAQLGWQAKVDFSTGVGHMLESIELWREAPLWDAGSIHQATKSWFKYLGDN